MIREKYELFGPSGYKSKSFFRVLDQEKINLRPHLNLTLVSSAMLKATLITLIESNTQQALYTLDLSIPKTRK